ncbi:hypothetical protein B0H13DRAFT_909253 [Mycena leptocephala]|nr:hypothetical protein B0H13DRAFT_909253 [Mycena leptocephala]
MSSPPQLQLSLPPNTTSFKRSFEQFGFDLESPLPPSLIPMNPSMARVAPPLPPARAPGVQTATRTGAKGPAVQQSQ